MNKTGIILLIVILLIDVSVYPTARADDYYRIELVGYRWYRNQIPVEIDTQNQTLYNVAVDGMQTWNKAMEWNRDNYDPQGSLYQFTVAAQGPVAINFGIPYERKQIGYIQLPFPCFECTGITYYRGSRNEMTHVDITINNSSYLAASPYGLRVTILQALMHELGHALGLGHTNVTQDLMNQYFDIGQATGVTVYPTTLDLYGIQVLADGAVKDSVTLPSSIPYKMFPMKRQLEVRVPPQVSLVIDSQTYPAGNVQTTVSVGEHTVEAPTIVRVSEGTRIGFVSWSESGRIMSQNRAVRIQVLDDITLEGVYDTQYRLAIMDRNGKTLNEWWYNSGATAGFVSPNVDETVVMEGVPGLVGGLWRLQGWLDNGRPITPNSLVVMNEPHTIRPRYTADYTITLTALIVIATVAILLVIRARRSHTNTVQENEGVEERLFCMSCGAQLPPDSKFCNQCGTAQENVSRNV
jgi:hypothetical protein